MNNPQISIITPVYNAEKYLKRCIDSILKQTYTNFELLLINDGSTDSSPQICGEYAKMDNRIHVFHKKNGGVASARQLGTDNAKGEYLIHVDADDWIEPTMLSQLYDKACESGADVVLCDYYVNSPTEQIYISQKPTDETAKGVLREMFQRLHGSLCNKLAKRACYKEHNVHFISGIDYCEDVLIWVQLLQHNIKLVYLPQAFYHYRMTPTSITHNITRKSYDMRIKYRDALSQLLRLPDAKDIIESVSFNIFTEAFVHNVLTQEEIKQGLKQYKKQVYKVKSPKWKLGFLLLAWGFSNTAHKLIHY